MSAKRQLVDRCLAYAGLQPSPSIAEDEHRLVGLFADLRSAPNQLATLLQNVEGADDIVGRFVHLTQPEFSAQTLYAVVQSGEPLRRASTAHLICAHYAAMGSLLREAGYSAEAEALTQGLRFEWRRPDPTRSFADDYLDEVFDFVSEHISAEHPAASLYEAAYGFAASYELAYFLLWPTIGDVETQDPFRPFAELWKLGAQWARDGRGSVFVWRAKSSARVPG